MHALRPYQVEGVEGCRALIARGVRRIVLVLATGGGKTIAAAYIIASALKRGSRILFLAHRRELIKQAVQKLVAMGIAPNQIGFMLGKERYIPVDHPERAVRRNPIAPVQVASVDTLRNRSRPHADLVIVDECHRALAKSYVDICSAYPDAVTLGLTATPYRADGKGLRDAFDELLVISTPKQLIADGHLVEPRVFTVPASKLPKLSGIRVRGGDYDEGELAAAVDQAGLVGDIVEHWQRLAEGRRTVAFAVSVEHSKHIAERFRAGGIAAEHLDGTTPTAERDAILARLERGETRVVSNCGVLCEGWDQPSVKVCILARPTKSTGLYLQQAGRILRPWNGESALILDHAGCAMEHGLPQDDREFSLEGRKKNQMKDRPPPCKACEKCFRLVPLNTRVCPSCGWVFPDPDGDKTKERAGELVELKPAEAPGARTYSREEMRAQFDAYVDDGRRQGSSPRWALVRYRAKFGLWPPHEWQSPT